MICLTLPLPPSVNSMYIKGRIKSAKYRRWLEVAGWEIIMQKSGWDTRMIAAASNIRLLEKYAAVIEVPRKMRADIDNVCKCLLDLLKQYVTADDKHCDELTVKRSDNIPKGQCLVTIRAAKKAEGE